MTSRTPRVTLGSEWIRRRLFWTTVLVLVALGGAGLATAVDRPHTDRYRPELGHVTDRHAAAWLGQLLDELAQAEDDVGQLATAGRRAFIGASAVALEEVQSAVDAGDDVAARVAQAAGPLIDLRATPPGGVETWRLGEANRERLARIDAAIIALADIEAAWQRLAVGAVLTVELVSAVGRHDAAVDGALSAGRDGDWQGALELLDRAAPALDEAESAGERLTPDHDSVELATLVDGHRAHDEALRALYARLAETDSLDDPVVDDLRRQVQQVRVAVPTTSETLGRVVADTAGPWLSTQLAAIEAARGSVSDALDEGDEEDTLEEVSP
jgi:hypothetical protein